jgi:hypothetical protein
MLESKRILYGRRDCAKEKKGRENEALFLALSGGSMIGAGFRKQIPLRSIPLVASITIKPSWNSLEVNVFFIQVSHSRLILQLKLSETAFFTVAL